MSVPEDGATARLGAGQRTSLSTSLSEVFGSAFPARPDWIFLLGVTLLFIAFFRPGIVAGHLLAPGDGQDYFLPMFLSRKTLWDPLLQNGYPLAADPQIMTWYPVARFFSLLAGWGWLGSWNAFILFCYIGAACSMYAYALSLMGKRAAAAVAGVAYSMSGFMMSHVEHVTFINAACWIPGVLLGLEQAARRASWRWALVATGCLSMMFLSGNPQLCLYTGLFVAARLAAMVLGREARMPTAIAVLAATAITTSGLVAIQLLPGRELQSLTPRATIAYSSFSVFSLHPVELLTGLFPYVLGSRGSPIYPQKYIGWNFVEESFHIGFVVLFLGLAALFLRPKQARYWGWAFLAVLLAASDGETALGPLLFHVPYYQLFRCHGRWLLFADFSAALLAGYGVAALLEGIPWRNALRLFGRFLAVIAAAVFALFTLAPWIEQRAAQLGFGDYRISLQLNAVRIPLVIATLGAAALLAWMRYPKSRVAQALAAGVLLASLASEGRYDNWRTQPFTTADVRPPAALDGFGREALARGGSLFSLDPSGYPTYEGEPVDFSSSWRWPSMSFYHSLYVDRLGEILAMSDNGLYHGLAVMFMGPTPDLYGMRFINVTPRPAAATIAYGNLQLPDSHLVFAIGSSPALPRSTPVPIPPDTQKVLLVSALGSSIPIQQGETVAEAVVSMGSGSQTVYPIRAGIDTAEHAWECADVRPAIHHGLAPVFETQMTPRGGQMCAEHEYIATLDLGRHEPVREMAFRYVHPVGALMVSRVWYVRADGSVSAADLTSGVTESPLHWRERGTTPHARVFENLRVMERAWVARSVRKLAPADIRFAIQNGAFADGSPFDPHQTALVESDVPGRSDSSAGAAGRVQVTQPSDTTLEVTADAPARGFLVVRDIDYPGWRAWRNGAEVPIYRTNYIQRGVSLEAGQNHIRFEYVPASFRWGAVVTLGAVLFVLATCLIGRLKLLMDGLLGRA